MSIYTITRGGEEEFAGHEFVYEATTDLFRCERCRQYEVAVRDRQSKAITACPGRLNGGPGWHVR